MIIRLLNRANNPDPTTDETLLLIILVFINCILCKLKFLFVDLNLFSQFFPPYWSPRHLFQKTYAKEPETLDRNLSSMFLSDLSGSGPEDVW